MNKLTICFIAFLTVIMLQGSVVNAQSYKSALVSDKIIVNYNEHMVVAFTKPVKNKPAYRDQDFYWFSGQTINHTRGGYSGKLLNGKYEDFYLNKSLKSSGWFNQGLKAGSWRNWDEKGNLTDEYSWSKGKKNGKYFKFDLSGKQTESGKYKNDLLNGKQTLTQDSIQVRYFTDGKERLKHQYVPKFITKWFKK
jgi:hypothetical protein